MSYTNRKGEKKLKIYNWQKFYNLPISPMVFTLNTFEPSSLPTMISPFDIHTNLMFFSTCTDLIFM